MSTTIDPPTRRGQALLATQPTAFTRWKRTFIPWQLVRFVAINLKMIRLIGLSHRR